MPSILVTRLSYGIQVSTVGSMLEGPCIRVNGLGLHWIIAENGISGRVSHASCYLPKTRHGVQLMNTKPEYKS